MTSSTTNIFCIDCYSDQLQQKKYQLPMSLINPTDTVFGILPIEVSKFNEDTKYRLMDEFEKKFLTHPPAYFKSITKRDCFSFDSYVDASKHLASKKSL